MSKWAVLVAAGIVCTFVLAPYVLAADIHTSAPFEWPFGAR